MKRLYNILMVCFLVIFISGCWDLKEIEKRGYVLGIGIDSYDQLKNEIAPIEDMEPYTGKKKYVFTVQIPIWKLGQGTLTGGGGAPKAERKTLEMSVPGNSLMEMNRELSTRSDFPPFYEDMVVVIISEDVARKGIQELTDWLFRDAEIRRTVKVYIAKGQAKHLLDVVPNIESYSAFYISKMDNNAYKTSKFQSKVNIGKLSEYLYAGEDFHLTMVNHDKNQIKLAEAGIMKKDRLVGVLDEVKTEALNLLLDKYLGGVIVVPCIEDPNEEITFEVSKAKTKIKPIKAGNKIDFEIESKIEGNIAEITCTKKHDLRNKQFINSVEKAIAKKVEDNLRKTLEELQHLKADPVLLISKVKAKEYEFWKKNKDVWSDKYFPKAKFKIKVKVSNTSTGLTD